MGSHALVICHGSTSKDHGVTAGAANIATANVLHIKNPKFFTSWRTESNALLFQKSSIFFLGHMDRL